jgi:DnaK suppressor protein
MPTSVKTSTVRVSKKDVEKYRRALLAKKDEISLELVKNKDAGQESSDEATQDIADKATSSYTKEFLFSLSDSERTLVQQIEKALARIDDGAFGTCTHCGNPLLERRLDAVPWTPYCVDCMELSEKGLLD